MIKCNFCRYSYLKNDKLVCGYFANDFGECGLTQSEIDKIVKNVVKTIKK